MQGRPRLIGRLAWAGVAALAGLVAIGFAITAATVALAHAFGMAVAAAIMTAPPAALAGVGYYLARRPAHAAQDQGPRELLAVRLARELIRKQPLSAVALFGAIGFVAARRPDAAADIGRGIARLMTP
jgi:hypothetical protein